jgi:hypothetical protein
MENEDGPTIHFVGVFAHVSDSGAYRHNRWYRSAMSLESATFDERTPLKFQFSLSRAGNATVLVVEFSGRYRIGCQGGPDATFMRDVTLTAAHLWRPDGVVLDLTDFAYEWGDNLEEVLGVGWVRNDPYWPPGPFDHIFRPAADEPEPPMPFAVGVGTKCRDAIATLLFGLETTRPATDAEHLFDCLAAALEYVHSRIF